MNVTKVSLAEVALPPSLKLLQIEELLENEDGRHHQSGGNDHNYLLYFGRNYVVGIYYIKYAIDTFVFTKVAVVCKHMFYIYQYTQNNKYCYEWKFV